jgi:hypothetical protein
MGVAEHPFELEVKFLEFIAEGMGNIDFPGRFDRRRQTGSEYPLIEPDQE